jgi:hypothetical protein
MVVVFSVFWDFVSSELSGECSAINSEKENSKNCVEFIYESELRLYEKILCHQFLKENSKKNELSLYMKVS